MSFIKAMQQRYTTKVYDASKKLPIEKIEELKEILRMSPSSINSQPWKFTFVRDPKTKQKLSEVSLTNHQKVTDCDTLIVFSKIDNIELFEKQINENLTERAVGYYVNFVKSKGEANIRNWFDKQVYLSLGVFLSACADMQIDSTPMEGIDTEKFDEVLGLTGYKTVVAVAIGGRDAEDFNQLEKKPKSRKPLEEVVKSI